MRPGPGEDPVLAPYRGRTVFPYELTSVRSGESVVLPESGMLPKDCAKTRIPGSDAADCRAKTRVFSGIPVAVREASNFDNPSRGGNEDDSQ